MTDSITQNVIPIWLRDTYARVQSGPLLSAEGYREENRNTEIEAAKSISQQSLPADENLFIRGSDVFTYLSKYRGDICSQTVAIIIRGLRDLYWTNRFSLSEDEITRLDITTRKPLPSFKDIFEYSSLDKYRDIFNTPLFQLFGDITEYSVINIPAKHFIESININAPIQAKIVGTDIVIQLDYQPYDLWDPDTKSIINYIDLKC